MSLSFCFFMALLMTFLAEPSDKKKQPSNSKRSGKKKKQPSSWDHIKNLLTCKQIEVWPSRAPSKPSYIAGYSKLGSCSSVCSFRDVLVHGNTSVVHRLHDSPENTTLGQGTSSLTRKTAVSRSSSSRSNGGGATSSKGLQLRKLYGCYECHMIVGPGRNPSSRTTICACPECGEVSPNIESLELHQAIKHAVSDMGPEDSGRNIVEMIFKSSWLKEDNSTCKIERILKVHNTQRTIQRFEDCRDAVKTRANANNKKNPRCAADGNELLRFHCTTLTCALGSRGSSSLCGSVPGCGVCTIIRHGFQGKASDGKGVRTTAGSGRAHDCLGSTDGRRAMLVCRVIAGRVRSVVDDAPAEENSKSPGSFDSASGYVGMYPDMEDLYVSNPRAILPCFVVIYKALQS